MSQASGKFWIRLVAAFGITALVGFIISRTIKRAREGKSGMPPGSLGLPFIGETLSYAKNPHHFFETRVTKYGPVFKTRILGRPVVCFTGPDAFTFFVNQATFDRREANPPHAQKLLYHDSLPLIDGPEHRQMRSAVMQVFRPEAAAKYLPIIEQTTQTYIEKWERLGSFAWVPEYKKLSASMCASLLLGAKPGTNSDELMEVLDSFSSGLNAIPINLPWTEYGRAMKSRDRLVSYIEDAIARHQELFYSDMLAEMMNARSQDGSPLSRRQLRAQMVHNFFAAYANIFRVLVLMSMSLAQNPGIMERARKEIVEQVSNGPISFEALGRLAYLDRVVKEVRRHNRIFASTFFDRVTVPVEYNGYQIPGDWKAMGGIFTTMQDDSVFTHPRLFDPDRFSPERAEDQKKPNSYIPQGGGPMEGHRCPAEDLTTTLMKAVAVLLLRSYTWQLPPQDMNLNDEPSPLPRDGLKVRFERLASSAKA